jgi:hypothetical protein
MKAERRHELKTNSLARGLEGVPEHWREYGSKVLLVVLVAAIVFLLVRYWNDKKVRDAEMVTSSMQTAHSELEQLKNLPIQLFGASASAVAEQRQRIAQQVDQAFSTVINSTKDPKTLGNAFLGQGDLNWMLANFPELPGAETLPSNLQIQNRDGLLDQARSWYEKVLEQGNSAAPSDVFYARLGLAAIAENQSQWDKAKAQYQSITDAADMPASFKEYATERLAQLPQLQTPALIVPRPPVAPAATAPASAPAVPAATSQPTTAPTAPTTSQP